MSLDIEKDVLTENLFDISNELIRPLFDGADYPWQVLPKIGEFVKHLTENIPSGFSEIMPGVLVGVDVKIAKEAHIEGPAIFCDGCEIRPSAFIRGNIFAGKGCVIGNSSELKNTVLLDGVQVPHYNYVGDSVLGNKAHMGAGSICSNLKADKKNVVIKTARKLDTGMRKVGAFIGDGADIGCGSVLNPGTVIGKNTNVYPITSVRGVIPANSIVKSLKEIVSKI
jgi:NDP-sugar pyrophosphorylase family protein